MNLQIQAVGTKGRRDHTVKEYVVLIKKSAPLQHNAIFLRQQYTILLHRQVSDGHVLGLKRDAQLSRDHEFSPSPRRQYATNEQSHSCEDADVPWKFLRG
jgi:hypothetical protein